MKKKPFLITRITPYYKINISITNKTLFWETNFSSWLEQVRCDKRNVLFFFFYWKQGQKMQLTLIVGVQHQLVILSLTKGTIAGILNPHLKTMSYD